MHIHIFFRMDSYCGLMNLVRGTFIWVFGIDMGILSLIWVFSIEFNMYAFSIEFGSKFKLS